MSLFSADVNDLRTLYINHLKIAHSVEKQIVEDGLPAMIQSASSAQLKEAFETHLEESKMHVSRLESILHELTGEESDTKCKVMATMISGAKNQAADAGNDAVRDVTLIASGNEVEHHEIAMYGTLRTWAVLLGFQEQAIALDKTLEEEEKGDALLTQIAESLNLQAPTVAYVKADL